MKIGLGPRATANLRGAPVLPTATLHDRFEPILPDVALCMNVGFGELLCGRRIAFHMDLGPASGAFRKSPLTLLRHPTRSKSPFS